MDKANYLCRIVHLAPIEREREIELLLLEWKMCFLSVTC